MIHVAITNNIASLGCRLLIQLIHHCGGIPVLIPFFLPMNSDLPKKVLLQEHLVRVEKMLSECKAVIIPGNRFDINPHVYGEKIIHPETEKNLCIDPYNVRFETECFMARYALNHDMPFIGICGGMHIMNAILGGKLVQHLPDNDQTHINHFDDSWKYIVRENQPYWERHYVHHIQTNKPPALPFVYMHAIDVCSGSVLGNLYEEVQKDIACVQELSLHHQGCFQAQLSDCFQPIAYAPDGLVEAAELKGYATMGLITQFHWEYNVGGIAMRLVQKLIYYAQLVVL